jgi:hypothetical protein
VPTKGLSSGVAADYAKLLTYAATNGQVRGFGSGQLPPGYLPMTKADNLGGLASYTLRAAASVKAQAGGLPPLVAANTKGQQGNTGNGNGNGGNPVGSGSTSPGGSGVTPPATGSSSPAPTLPGPTVAPPAAAAPVGRTAAFFSSVAGLVLPALLALAIVAGLLAPLITRFFGGRRSA